VGTERTEKAQESLMARLITGEMCPWSRLVAALLLLTAPLVFAVLDGVWDSFFTQGYWRIALLPTGIIVYILVASRVLARGDVRVVEAFRPLVLMEHDAFDKLVNEASQLGARWEILAFGVGGAFGLLVGRSWLPDRELLFLGAYLTVAAGLMFGLLGWVIYASLVSTRLSSRLHRQPLRIDIFDITPFEPIGRQSLAIALVFVGGIALSTVLGGGWGSLYVWQNWVVYPLLAVVPILVFFLNMRDTHRLLAAEKKAELEAVREKIVSASRALMERMAGEESTGTLGAEINALAAYEERVQAARTWPYDTSMLRTLFASVVVPGGAALASFLSDVLWR
jgi:hypothetical protein